MEFVNGQISIGYIKTKYGVPFSSMKYNFFKLRKLKNFHAQRMLYAQNFKILTRKY